MGREGREEERGEVLRKSRKLEHGCEVVEKECKFQMPQTLHNL